jgi:hypothetical protein
MNVITIASAAMIGNLNISSWEARIQDKATKEEVLATKGARSKRAASVSKHLFSECPALDAIKTLRGEAYLWFRKETMPWDDNGGRLITTRRYLQTMDQAAKYEQRFNALVNAFLGVYQTEISKQAFENGALFDRSEYPSEDEVRAKFRFALNVSPVPTSGDFRVDIGHEAAKQLAEQYERLAAERMSAALAEPWQRIKDQVLWVKERMEAVLAYDPDAVEEQPVTDPDGKVIDIKITKKRRPKLYDSMLENGLELCKTLSDFNITNDPRLEEARRELETALTRIDMDSLKESPELQKATKTAMQDILDRFAF